MARVVIDIPEDVKSRLANGITYRQDLQIISEALANGTVLHKGHGDLIDRDTLFTEYPEIAIEPYINAPTVIEADKENRND